MQHRSVSTPLRRHQPLQLLAACALQNLYLRRRSRCRSAGRRPRRAGDLKCAWWLYLIRSSRWMHAKARCIGWGRGSGRARVCGVGWRCQPPSVRRLHETAGSVADAAAVAADVIPVRSKPRLRLRAGDRLQKLAHHIHVHCSSSHFCGCPAIRIRECQQVRGGRA